MLASAGPYPGAGDKAANFDGSNDFVTVGNESLYDVTGPTSVAAWIKVDVFDDTEQAIFTKGNNAWRLQRYGSTNYVEFNCNGLSSASVVSAADVNDGKWHHVVGVYTGGQLQIYVDGVLSDLVASSGSIHTNDRAVRIGSNDQGSARNFDGSIHDVRIYSRGLSSAEVAKLYGLIGHWKLDETTGAVATDSSGNGRNMTVVGTPTWSAGSIDNCLRANGSTRAEVVSLLDNPQNTTLVGWANFTSADTSGAELVSLGDYFAIRLDTAGTTSAFFYNGSSWVACSVSQTFANTGWHHFAAVFNDDLNTCKLYIDGVESASVSTTVTIPYDALGTKTVIGAHGNNGTSWDFNGRLDDIRVYNRALSPTEIAALHAGGDPFEGVKIIKWIEIQ